MKKENKFEQPESDKKGGKEGDGNQFADLEQHMAQIIQNLPQFIADDKTLQQILKPSFDKNVKVNFPNVVPLEVNYGGMDPHPNNPNVMVTKTHTGKEYQFDKQKGFATSCWAKLSSGKQGGFTDKEGGLFIKHLTSSVITNNEANPGRSMQDNPPLYTTNAWTNVMVYTPDERIYKYDPNTKEVKKDK